MNTSALLKQILFSLKDIEKLIIAGQFEDAYEIGNDHFKKLKSQIPHIFRLRLFSALVSTSKLVLDDQITYKAGQKNALKILAETKSFFINALSDKALEEEETNVNKYIQEKIMRLARRRFK
jgi:hypothetical protein